MVIDCLKILGAIAQLGERLNGIQEVTGSIPVSSTKSQANGPPSRSTNPRSDQDGGFFVVRRRRRRSATGAGRAGRPVRNSCRRSGAAPHSSSPSLRLAQSCPDPPLSCQPPERGKKLALTSLPGRGNQIPFVHAFQGGHVPHRAVTDRSPVDHPAVDRPGGARIVRTRTPGTSIIRIEEGLCDCSGS